MSGSFSFRSWKIDSFSLSLLLAVLRALNPIVFDGSSLVVAYEEELSFPSTSLVSLLCLSLLPLL